MRLGYFNRPYLFKEKKGEDDEKNFSFVFGSCAVIGGECYAHHRR
jgi:hypothetical protein